MTQKETLATKSPTSEHEPFYFRPENADYFRGTRRRLMIGETTSYLWAAFSVPLMIVIGYLIWWGTMRATNDNTVCGVVAGAFGFMLAMAVIGGADQEAKQMEALTSGKAKIIDATYTYNAVFNSGRNGPTLYVAYEFTSPMTGKLIKDTRQRSLGMFEAEPNVDAPCPGRILYISDRTYVLL